MAYSQPLVKARGLTFTVIVTCIVGVFFAHNVIGIGVGTLIAMIGVGRVIAVFNRLTKDKTDMLAGLSM